MRFIWRAGGGRHDQPGFDNTMRYGRCNGRRMHAMARWLIGCGSGLLNWRNRLYNTLVIYELLRGIDGIEQGGISRANKFRDMIGRLQGDIELAQALLAVLTIVVAASAGVFSFVHRLL